MFIEQHHTYPGFTLLQKNWHISDLDETSDMIKKRKLEGRQLTVSKVSISNCLLVENLSSKTTEDTVWLYFENKRSNGGPVERVEMAADGIKCLVYFESHEGDDKYIDADF